MRIREFRRGGPGNSLYPMEHMESIHGVARWAFGEHVPEYDLANR